MPRYALPVPDRAEAEAWSIQMEGYGGPAQPSPTIGQCLNGYLAAHEASSARGRIAPCDSNRKGHSPCDKHARYSKNNLEFFHRITIDFASSKALAEE